MVGWQFLGGQVRDRVCPCRLVRVVGEGLLGGIGVDVTHLIDHWDPALIQTVLDSSIAGLGGTVGQIGVDTQQHLLVSPKEQKTRGDEQALEIIILYLLSIAMQ